MRDRKTVRTACLSTYTGTVHKFAPTCAKKLYLPAYDSWEAFESKMQRAMHEFQSDAANVGGATMGYA